MPDLETLAHIARVVSTLGLVASPIAWAVWVIHRHQEHDDR